MAILAGIDEAGYGPMLGPLLVSGAVFRVPDAKLNHCLWETLAETCTKSCNKHDKRLTITDSKKLFHQRSNPAALERTALVMLAVAGHRPDTWHRLLDVIAPNAGAQGKEYPWYRESTLTLPRCDGVGDITTKANAIVRDCNNQHIAFLGASCEVMYEGEFNRLVAQTQNKATVLLNLVFRIAERIRHSAGEKRVRIQVDRLGGRVHYREAILLSWPEFALQVVEESPDRSAYRLKKGGQIFEIAFTPRGDDRFLPVALASIYSKYMRESYMHFFNTHWSKKIEGLRPTAGYYTDAQRWLDDAASAIAEIGIDRKMLVRER